MLLSGMLRPCPWASNELPGQFTPNREVRRSRGLSSSPDGRLSGGCPLLGSFICSQQGQEGVEERAEGWEAKPFQEELTPIVSLVLGNCAECFLAITSLHTGVSLIAQLVRNPSAIQEIWVRSLGWEDPLEKGKADHSSILAWRIPGTV